VQIQGGSVKKALSFVLFAAAFLTTSAATAQNPNYNPGSVWRVTYYSIKPGQGDAFWKDIRDHFRPIYDDFKKAGLISEFKFKGNADDTSTWDCEGSYSGAK
jgi:hypothetical protein